MAMTWREIRSVAQMGVTTLTASQRRTLLTLNAQGGQGAKLSNHHAEGTVPLSSAKVLAQMGLVDFRGQVVVINQKGWHMARNFVDCDSVYGSNLEPPLEPRAELLIKRDGEILATARTVAEARAFLLWNHPSSSVGHALKWEGYSVENPDGSKAMEGY